MVDIQQSSWEALEQLVRAHTVGDIKPNAFARNVTLIVTEEGKRMQAEMDEREKAFENIQK